MLLELFWELTEKKKNTPGAFCDHVGTVGFFSESKKKKKANPRKKQNDWPADAYDFEKARGAYPVPSLAVANRAVWLFYGPQVMVSNWVKQTYPNHMYLYDSCRCHQLFTNIPNQSQAEQVAATFSSVTKVTPRRHGLTKRDKTFSLGISQVQIRRDSRRAQMPQLRRADPTDAYELVAASHRRVHPLKRFDLIEAAGHEAYVEQAIVCRKTKTRGKIII